MTAAIKCVIVLSTIFWSAQAQFSPQWQSGEDGRIQWAHDCDFDGDNLGNVRSKGEECGGLCYQKEACTRFLWTREHGGTCHFKAGNAQAFYANNGVGAVCGYVTTEKFIENGISWIFADANRIRWAANCDFTGPNVEVRKVAGDQCGAQCLSRLECIGFVWTSYEGGTCWLKSRGHPILAYTEPGGVCGEIIGRKGSYGSSRDLEFRCGGTIISDYHVLTAAHCVDPGPVLVQLGTHILNDAKKINILVESCTQHEHFSYESRKNDIALVKLEQRITFSNRILPACLRINTNDVPWNEELVVTGWGLTEEGKLSDILKKVSLQTVELRTCQADYLKAGPGVSVEPKNFIVNISVQGDSGGPIQMFEHGSPLATVVGITSFGHGKECPSDLAGIYTRVASFLDWIEDKVWDD